MDEKLQSSAKSTSERSSSLVYVLITPARNEAAFIEKTIQSVISQTVKPAKWVIVSDGSTDGTDEIVKRYAREYDWIELVRMPERKERHFAGKVHAFNAGYERVENMRFDIVGNLDADITFDEDYFSFLLKKFQANPNLGVGGTPFKEKHHQYDYRFASTQHVSGACQLFRRQCFEDIGGYTPLKVGGIDLVAVTTARMKGWETRTFTEKTCFHHRETQGGKDTSLKRTFWSGYHDYLMGSSPAWQIFRSIYHMSKSPFLVGGGCLLAGFLWAMLKRAEKPVSKEFVAFRRKEQWERLRTLVANRMVLKRFVGQP